MSRQVNELALNNLRKQLKARIEEEEEAKSESNRILERQKEIITEQNRLRDEAKNLTNQGRRNYKRCNDAKQERELKEAQVSVFKFNFLDVIRNFNSH